MLDGANHHAYSNTNWPKCQRCQGEMALACQNGDYYAFRCMKCGCIRAWATPSSTSRARAQVAVNRREEAHKLVRAWESRPRYFDLGANR